MMESIRARRRPWLAAAAGWAILALVSGCKDKGGDDATSATEAGRRDETIVLKAIEVLIAASDRATSAVTLRLPNGRDIEGRVRKPRAISEARPPKRVEYADPLGRAGRAAAVQPVSPRAFDWAPGSDEELVVADAAGLWAVAATTGAKELRFRWPDDWRPTTVAADAAGRILVWGEGTGFVMDWPSTKNVCRFPSGVPSSYAFFHPKTQQVVSVVERLDFNFPPDAIRLSGLVWDPDSGRAEPYDGPPLGDLAWLGADVRAGHWFSLQRDPGVFDPWPARLWLARGAATSWEAASVTGRWTDASPSVARDGAAVWIRRIRRAWPAGRPWFAPAHRDADAGALMLGDENAVALSDRNAWKIVLSSGGQRIACAFARGAMETDGDGDEATELVVAELSACLAAARGANLGAGDADRERRQDAIVEMLRDAWKATGGYERGGSPAEPGSGVAREAAEANIRRLDAAFVEAARTGLGVEADHTVGSLAEIDEWLDGLGGDFGSEPAAVACLAAYYGETILRATAKSEEAREDSPAARARRATVPGGASPPRPSSPVTSSGWALTEWPPDVYDPEPDLSLSDDFLYTLHSPFSVAAHALDERLSLARTADALLRDWARPVQLAGRFHEGLLAPIQREALRARGLEWLMESEESDEAVKARESALKPEQYRAFAASPPDDDWALLALVHGLEGNADAMPRWPFAVEVVGRHPDSARAFAFLGEMLGKDGYTAAALEARRRAAVMEPLSVDDAVAVGMAALDASQFDTAGIWLVRARALDADNQWKEVIDEALKGLGLDQATEGD